MQVIVAHSPDADTQELRRVVLGSGLECGMQDCVPWSDLAVRLGRGDADLVLVNVDHREQQSWQALQGAKALTEARILAVGAKRDERVIRDPGTLERDVREHEKTNHHETENRYGPRIHLSMTCLRKFRSPMSW